MWKKALWFISMVAVFTAYSAEKSYTLVFFLNPNGGPCIAQNAILAENQVELAKLVQLRYVSTEVPADRVLFYQFGIRALPSLVIVDENGKELKRFSPGIQSAEQILATVKALGK